MIFRRLSKEEDNEQLAETYKKLTLPVMRNYYPKLIAKELVNVMPIDKPDCIKKAMYPKDLQYYRSIGKEITKQVIKPFFKKI